MEKKLIAFVLIVLSVGLISYGLALVVHQSQYQSLLETIDTLNDKIETINSTLSTTWATAPDAQIRLGPYAYMNVTLAKNKAVIQNYIDVYVQQIAGFRNVTIAARHLQQGRMQISVVLVIGGIEFEVGKWTLSAETPDLIYTFEVKSELLIIHVTSIGVISYYSLGLYATC